MTQDTTADDVMSGWSTEAPAPLPRLKVPVHILLVSRAAQWPDLLSDTSAASLPDADAYRDRIIEGDDCWIAQTYLRLRARGLPVTMSGNYRIDAINIVSYHDLKARDFPQRYFTLAVREDSAPACLADQVVVQNILNVESPARHHFIPHWPQPGLMERDRGRSTQVKRVCFKGAAENLHASFRSEAFRASLAAMGMELVFDQKGEAAPPRWFDYRTCDVLLAVRDATLEDMKLKPASKLVNAWRAGCPAILGPEPAFQHLRQSPLDYFEVLSPDGAIAALRQLVDDPARYARIIENGRMRGQAFSPNAVAQRWHDVLAGPVTDAFLTWRKRRTIAAPARLAALAVRFWQDKRARKLYRARRDHGYRPISRTTT